MLRSKTNKLKFAFCAAALSGAISACPLHFDVEDTEGLLLPGASQMIFKSIFLEKSKDIESIAKLQPAPTFHRASWWLKLFAKSLAENEIEDTYVLLVDIPMWSKLDASNSSNISIDVNVPDSPRNVIMLTQLSLNALVSKSLTVQEALELGLVKIHDGDDETHSKLQSFSIK